MGRDRSRSRLSFRLQELAKAEPALEAVASAVARSGEGGAPLDAHSFLGTGIPVTRSVLLDLAYEEYCGREEAGETINLGAFCERFPNIRSSLRRQLDVHRLLQENPDLLQEISEAQWPEVPETFLGFSLVRELGSGAFARVFLATEPALGDRRVVVKVSLEGHAEAQTLGRLDHPNVVPILTVRADIDGGLTAICMPYAGCATLCDVIDHVHGGNKAPARASVILDAVLFKTREFDLSEKPSRPAPPLLQHGEFQEGVLLLACQLAEGLAFVHERGVCHRDLKPSNILVAADGRPMLLDFNLSADDRHGGGRLGGTLPYMSPEQLRATTGTGERIIVDFRSDLYSFGVVLFQTLTGRRPFGPLPSSGDMRALLLSRQQAGPHSLRSIMPYLDRRFRQAIEECLSFNPNRRPASAAALAGEFRHLLGWRRRASRRLARHWKLAVAATSGLLIAGTIAWVLMPSPEPFHVKQRKAAEVAYRQGEFQPAIEHYTQVLMAAPESAEAYFGRGRALTKRNEFLLASTDFGKAFKFSNDVRAKACLAYCRGRLGMHESAVDYGQATIDLGYANAAVWNNIGYSQYHIGNLDAAERSLGRAIALNDHLQTAYHNRARVDRQRFFPKKDRVPRSGLADIRKAIELGPATADLYFDAAYLSACAATLETGHIEPALRYMSHAIKLGHDPAAFKKDSAFAVLRTEPRFNELIKVSPSKRKPAPAPRLIDPVDD